MLSHIFKKLKVEIWGQAGDAVLKKIVFNFYNFGWSLPNLFLCTLLDAGIGKKGSVYRIKMSLLKKLKSPLPFFWQHIYDVMYFKKGRTHL